MEIFFDDSMNPVNQAAEELSRIFIHRGIILSGKAPNFSTDGIKQNEKFSLAKAKEIRAWLEQHVNCKDYIVIDDLDLHDLGLMKHQMRPNPAVGLTESDNKKIIMYFLRTNK